IDWEDVTRWKVINKTLDLPFDEPVETYSTSEHLFTEMNIPEDVTGRLKAAQPTSGQSKSGQGKSRQHKSGQGKPGRGKPGSGPRSKTRHQGRPSPQGSSGAQPARHPSSRRRRRRRTRSGTPVEPSGHSQSSQQPSSQPL